MAESTSYYSFYDLPMPLAPIMAASPHSGRNYPAEFISQIVLDDKKLRASEDFYVDELIIDGILGKLPFIKGEIGRILLDLNRAPHSLDQKLINGLKGTKYCQYARAGIGIIPRLLNKTTEIYHSKIDISTVEQRIAQIHTPYHGHISQKLREMKDEFGRALLIDFHSMPHAALGTNQCDIVIGNYYNRSATKRTCDLIEDFFSRNGFKVRLNQPYAGGFTTQHHANLQSKIEVVQIEINRALYFDEENQEKTKEFETLKQLIAAMLSHLMGTF